MATYPNPNPSPNLKPYALTQVCERGDLPATFEPEKVYVINGGAR